MEDGRYETVQNTFDSKLKAQAPLTASLKAHESEIFYTANVIDNFPIAITAEEIVEPVAVHRVYNPASGEHLFTTDGNEVATLVNGSGWREEPLGWNAPSKSLLAVNRLLNPYTGEHLYTMDGNEVRGLVAAGWTDEGVKLWGM